MVTVTTFIQDFYKKRSSLKKLTHTTQPPPISTWDSGVRTGALEAVLDKSHIVANSRAKTLKEPV